MNGCGVFASVRVFYHLDFFSSLFFLTSPSAPRPDSNTSREAARLVPGGPRVFFSSDRIIIKNDDDDDDRVSPPARRAPSRRTTLPLPKSGNHYC